MTIEEQRKAAGEYIQHLITSDIEDRHVRNETGRLISLLLFTPINLARSGNETAIALLVDTARGLVDDLNEASLRNLNAYKRVAETRNLWPVVTRRHKTSFEEARKFIEGIALGARTGIGYGNPKSFTWKHETGIAADLYAELYAMRQFPERFPPWQILPEEFQQPYRGWHELTAKLPLLTRKDHVVKRWWKPVWLLFLDRYGPAYETDRAFVHHWVSPTFAPKGKPAGPEQRHKLTEVRRVYATLMEWYLHAAGPRRRPRRQWPGHDLALQAANYPDGKKGTWEYAAGRLPVLSQRDLSVDRWFEASRLLYADFGPALLSATEFPIYMKNALRIRKRIRKYIKDLLEQGLKSIAAKDEP